MKSNTWIMISMIVVLVSFILEFFIFIGPSLYKAYILAQPDETEIADRDNYKLHTTPLSGAVLDDLCLKLDLKDRSEHCQPETVVYAPDLFDEIRLYFRELPREDQTYDTVQAKLGSYLVLCESPDSEGFFRCRYDLRGDQVYPVFFDFDKKGFFWQITANAGGDS